MKDLLIFGSLIVAVVAVLFVNITTLGVFLIGVACWLCINARMYQADSHQKELLEWLKWMKQSNHVTHKED